MRNLKSGAMSRDGECRCRLEKLNPLASEGRGHKFESCRARQIQRLGEWYLGWLTVAEARRKQSRGGYSDSLSHDWPVNEARMLLDGLAQAAHRPLFGRSTYRSTSSSESTRSAASSMSWPLRIDQRKTKECPGSMSAHLGTSRLAPLAAPISDSAAVRQPARDTLGWVGPGRYNSRHAAEPENQLLWICLYFTTTYTPAMIPKARGFSVRIPLGSLVGQPVIRRRAPPSPAPAGRDSAGAAPRR
jgi:hypothetical protein